MHRENYQSNELKVTFLDLETTEKNPHTAEILTAFLRTRNLNDFTIIDELYLTFRPEAYRHDSYRIHGISYDESLNFSDKWCSLRNLILYFAKYKDSIFCCHANHLVYGIYGHFDEQVIKQVCLSRSSELYYWFLKQKFQFISTHTIAKNSVAIDGYSLNKIADYFGFEFNHHNAKSDVEVMEKIFHRLVDKNITKENLLQIGNYKFKNEEQDGKRSILQ